MSSSDEPLQQNENDSKKVAERVPSEKSSCAFFKKYKSSLLMLFSAFLFSVQGIFVKLAHETGVPSLQLVFSRSSFQLIFVIAAFFYYKVRFLPPKNVRWYVFFRGICGGIGFAVYYHSITVLPLGDAITLLSLYPILCVFAGAIFLKEKLQIPSVFAAFACVAGAFLVSRPTFLFPLTHKNGSLATTTLLSAWNSSNSIGTLLSSKTSGYITATIGSLMGSFVYTLIRLSKDAHTLHLLFAWASCSVVISAVLGNTIQHFILPSSGLSWAYIFLVCLFGSVGHVLMNYSGRLIPVAIASVLRATDIVFAYIWEVAIFAVVPYASTYGGCVLIIASIATVSLQKKCKIKKLCKRAQNYATLPVENEKLEYDTASDSGDEVIQL